MVMQFGDSVHQIFFSGRCLFLGHLYVKPFTSGYRLGPMGICGLDFLFSGSSTFRLGACGALVIAGCGCVGFLVLLCYPWGCACGRTATHPNVMPLNLQI